MGIVNLKACLAHFPQEPGVYQMIDEVGQILYVGKARNLKKRLTSYFHRRLDNKTQSLMAKVVHVETTITASENEALLLEAHLIKEKQPRYNVLLRDDKSYPYLYLSTHQAFPRLDFYRGAKRQPGRYFGPYPSAGSVRENLTLIQKLFKLRQCNDSFFRHRTRPCLQYQIKRCTAPCVGYVTEEHYRQQVTDAILFLEGHNERVIEKLAEHMEVAASRLAYEEASEYRNQIAQLRRLQKQPLGATAMHQTDVIGVSRDALGQIAFSVLLVRGGRWIGSRTFLPNTPREIDTASALASFVTQYYLSPTRNGDIPEHIVLSEEVEDRLWIQSALREKWGRQLMVIDRHLATYRRWQNVAAENAKQALVQHLSRQNTVAQQLEALQKMLQLPNPIQRIECFDVSHTQGEATVAACVVLGLEGEIKKEYRRFNIVNVPPGDDYGALRQALERHYVRLKQVEGGLPDLLVIDGGKGQIHQAADVLEELQVSGVVLLGVAKGVGRKPGLETVYLWGKKTPFRLSPQDPALHLIQRVRDEAHRFAITGHRAQRSKRRLESPLQNIVGVGVQRRRLLLRHFGGWRELRRASVSELTHIPGISESLAQRIHDALQK
ncbi:MAG: excinuclease ABC subunit C [Coxiella sp. RIFCSPHIGHO2_12_FULL_44_14]|nr:MAG: excinuclease ABC subunit C [Coxiella sp. RIFCSPHIGHO2_12_FULL_44_14]